jgi:hypothetical protein
MANLHPSEEESQLYSGQVTYEKVFDLPADLNRHLDDPGFGAGTPVAKPDPLPTFNLRAFPEGRCGCGGNLWKRSAELSGTSYTVDVSSLLKAGTTNYASSLAILRLILWPTRPARLSAAL